MIGLSSEIFDDSGELGTGLNVIAAGRRGGRS